MHQTANRTGIVERSRVRASSLAARAAALAIRVIACIAVAGSNAAAAAEIVALGASNTAGVGVSRDQAYPAQLQAMLRAKGIDASIANAGRSGDTAAGMLSRVGSAVPQGTRIVILDPGNNDIKACTEPSRPQRCATPAQHDSTVAAIAGRLRARGIKVFMANIEFRSIAIANWQADRRHLTPEGYRIIAARLLPEVAAALGQGAR